MKTHRQKRREYFRLQKLVGLAVIIFALIVTWLGVVIDATECGAILLAIPAGLWMIFTKDMVLDLGYKVEVEKKQRAQ